ncbi:hypothetical protein, partial [Aeromonas caviae]|uniref:hypothetical protein n=1 Tax=Aeromonas caviae TaxID=648 RepID=UPI003F747FB4
GAKDENTGAGLCRSRLVVQERLGHYSSTLSFDRSNSLLKIASMSNKKLYNKLLLIAPAGLGRPTLRVVRPKVNSYAKGDAP